MCECVSPELTCAVILDEAVQCTTHCNEELRAGLVTQVEKDHPQVRVQGDSASDGDTVIALALVMSASLGDTVMSGYCHVS